MVLLSFVPVQLQDTPTETHSNKRSVRTETQAGFPRGKSRKLQETVAGAGPPAPEAREGFFRSVSAAGVNPYVFFVSMSSGAAEPLSRGASPLSLQLRQGIGCAAEAQIGSRAVGGVLAAGCTAVPVAVRLERTGKWSLGPATARVPLGERVSDTARHSKHVGKPDELTRIKIAVLEIRETVLRRDQLQQMQRGV